MILPPPLIGAHSGPICRGMHERRHELMRHDAALGALGDIEQFISGGLLVPAFQPIVDLERPSAPEVVGYEALARWPSVPGATPDAVFALARLEGVTADLDWECRLGGIEAALEHGIGRKQVLFLNVEPEALGMSAPPGGEELLEAARRRLRIVLELTERSLLRRPAELLRLVGWARDVGWGIALDDVGADPASLALLPFLAPDVIKLDMQLVRHRPDADRAAIMAAVMSHSERTGAAVLAEGIENDEHLEQALALGATLGQGWAFGRPGPLAAVAAPAPMRPLMFDHREFEVPATPFDLVRERAALRTGRKGLLLDLTRHIERQALVQRPAAVVLSAFQTADRFTPATAARYEELAEQSPLVAALGVGLGATPASGVHGASIRPDDPLADEWTVTVIGPHYAAALVARDLGDTGPDHERRYSFAITHDRELVLAAARSLMVRVVTRTRRSHPSEFRRS